MDVGIAADALVRREDRAGVAWLTLNRPGRANVLSSEMLAGLEAGLRAVAEDAAIRVVVIAAAGRNFCAGHDLAEIRAHTDAAWQTALFDACSRLMQLIGTLRLPVIACVQGTAVAAGCQLVAACDLAYAAEGARFGVNGIDLGLFCGTPSVALTRAVPRKAAMELLLTGKLIGAAEAARIGLVNAAVPAEALVAQVADVAARIAQKQPEAIALGKALVGRQIERPLSEAYLLAGAAMVQNLALPATSAAIDAFLARRR